MGAEQRLYDFRLKPGKHAPERPCRWDTRSGNPHIVITIAGVSCKIIRHPGVRHTLLQMGCLVKKEVVR